MVPKKAKRKRPGAPLRLVEPIRDKSVPDYLWNLPHRVREAARRVDTKITQKQLAEAAGLDQSRISRLLHFKRLAKMEADTVVKLSRALKVPVDFLLSQDETEVAPDSAVVPSSRMSGAPAR